MPTTLLVALPDFQTFPTALRIAFKGNFFLKRKRMYEVVNKLRSTPHEL